ncbi:hypothetical protein DK37_30345 [Halomonas sp. SUBG004]|nr:hypothetical protein DK37_30345 [Halomonas sp. SUBG004]
MNSNAAASDGTAFENVTLGDAAETQVVDTIDTVTATLSADASSVAEGGTVTYTVTLTGPQARPHGPQRPRVPPGRRQHRHHRRRCNQRQHHP